MPSVDRYSIDPLGVAQRRSPQQDLVDVQGHLLCSLLQPHRAKEFVDELVFFLALNCCVVEVQHAILVGL